MSKATSPPPHSPHRAHPPHTLLRGGSDADSNSSVDTDQCPKSPDLCAGERVDLAKNFEDAKSKATWITTGAAVLYAVCTYDMAVGQYFGRAVEILHALPEDPTAPRSALQVAVELVPPSLTILLGFSCCWVVMRRNWPNHKDPIAMADILFSVPFFPMLSGYACLGTWELSGSVDSRWQLSTPRARFFLVLYVSRQLTHFIFQLCQKMDTGHLILMTLHHITSIVCFTGGLITGNMHFWACFDGVCEITTVFLTNMLLMREIPGWKEGLPYAVNGVTLWATFLIFRVVLFPVWLWIWYHDVTEHTAKTWDYVSSMERYLYPAVTTFLLCLSLMWFGKITNGMLNALGFGKKSKRKSKTA